MRLAVLTILAAASVAAACTARQDAAALQPERASVRGDISLVADVLVTSARVSARATLASLLRAHHVDDGEAARAVAQAASVFDPRKMRSSRARRVRRLWSDPRGRVQQCRADVAGGALHAPKRRARLLRRARRLDAPLLPAVSAQVRAGRLVAFFAQPVASHSARVPAAP